eukprot:scaffold2140_cov394-Prasinococcus_capsulatus_cf.AAC.10
MKIEQEGIMTTALPASSFETSEQRIRTRGPPKGTIYLDVEHMLVSGVGRDEGKASVKVVVLRLKKPVLFKFHPGQYVYLSCPTIDGSWHPFSIGSAPEQGAQINDDEPYICRLGDRNST